MHLNEKTLNSTLLYDGKILKLYKDEARLENGGTAVREYVRHSGGVGIVPLTADGNVILVKQFRYPYKQAILEIPAGKLEIGEHAFECAKRELAEETGCSAGDFTFLGELYPTPAYDDEIIHMYLAEDLSDIDGKLDDDEFLDTVKIPFKKAIEMVIEGEIKDAKTQAALLKTFFLRNIESKTITEVFL